MPLLVPLIMSVPNLVLKVEEEVVEEVELVNKENVLKVVNVANEYNWTFSVLL